MSEAGSGSRGESEGARGERERERRGGESVCVDDGRGLHPSRLRDAEVGRDDAERDGHSWLQRRGGGVRNRYGRNERLEVRALEPREKGEIGLYIRCLEVLPWPRPGEGVKYKYANYFSAHVSERVVTRSDNIRR